MQNLSKKLPNYVTDQYNPVHLKSNSNKSNSFVINYYNKLFSMGFNHLTPNGHFSGRTAPLTYRCCIFFIYSTDIRTEYFKHAAHSPFFPLQNIVYFIMLPFFGYCIIHILYTGCAKI